MYNQKLHFHFIGIGGSGMSGLAEILVRSGFRVSGSDLIIGETCDRLSQLGVTVFKGHAAENVPTSCSLVVYTSAVGDTNPEIQAARSRKLPIVRRAEVLAELMRLKYGVAVAGSHGKTTTTSMVGAILEHAGLDPTVIIGGQVKAIGSGGKLGQGDYLVAESDESDRSFLLLKPTVAVVTNIDSEHLDAYSSFAELVDSFRSFVNSVPFYGLAVLCVDDPKVRDLMSSCHGRTVTYGVSPDAVVRAEAIELHRDSASCTVLRNGRELFRLRLPLPGKHLLVNSLAAIAVGLEFDVPPEKIREALEGFTGVARRLETVGTVRGVTVISDYGHHPTEIRATIAALRDGWRDQGGRLHVFFQPHRYSRTVRCFAEFVEAFSGCDQLVLTEIYSAGEDPISGVTGRTLFDAVVHPQKAFVEALDNLPESVLCQFGVGDVVLCLGAGSIGHLPARLLTEIEQFHSGRHAA